MGRPFRHGWRGWFWPALLAGVIVFASGRSQVAAPDIVGFDKAAHFAIFGLLATLVVRNGEGARWAVVAVVSVSVFGATDEWHQGLTTGRSVQALDWVADTLGAVVAVALRAASPAYRRALERNLKSRVEQPAALPPNRPVA